MASNVSYSLADIITEILNNEERSVATIAKISGVSASTIRGWVNDKKTPTINNAQWVLSALGYRLTLEKTVEKIEDKTVENVINETEQAEREK